MADTPLYQINFIVRGHVMKPDGSTVAGITVRAFDKEIEQEKIIGTAVSDINGQYIIKFTSQNLSRPDKAYPDLIVRGYDPAGNLVAASRLITGVTSADQIVILRIGTIESPEPPVQVPEAPLTAIKVKGRVQQQDGSPLAGATVQAFDKDLRHEQLLGEPAVTDKEGSYEISYTSDQFYRAEKENADLIIRVYSAEENLLAESDIIFNAQPEQVVDLVLREAEPEKSEYERLLAELSPLLEGVKIDELTPDDIVFLTGETGLERGLIGYLVSAAKLAGTTGLAASVHYGLLRENLPVDLSALFRQGRQAQQRALDAAVKNKRIPVLSSDEQDEILDRLQDLFIESTLDEQEDPIKLSLGGLLATTLLPLSLSQKKAFLKLHLQTEPTEDLWESLRRDPEFQQEGLVDELKVTVQIGNLTQNHLPLVRSVQKLRQEGRLGTFRDLARLTVEEWVSLINRSKEEQEPVVPPNITGDTDAEKINNYARQISEQLENLFPTLSIAYRVEQDDLPQKENLSAFFNRSIIDRESLNSDIPEFDFATTHVDRYLEDHADTLLADNMDREALSLQLKTMQRLFRVTPYYAELRPLLLNGFHSAQSIVRMGTTQFVKRFAGQLGGEARTIELFDKAELQNAMATALLVSYSPAYHGVAPKVVPVAPQPSDNDLAIIPDWPSLFGSLDFCACKHCQSVYSPAAYLVDVLHFLKEACPAKTANKTAKDVLFERRSDIGKIELSCANTNTPVPYIDLVNEILENTVAPSNVIPQTRDSAEEISANPEYLNPDAYNKLREEVFPWSLPFDLWAEECRVYLQQLGAARHEIIEVFSNNPRRDSLINAGIACEYLGLNLKEWNLIVTIQPHHAWEYWGYPKSPEPSGWLGEIRHVPVFLQKSGLSHGELLDLLNTRIINPDPTHRILDISPPDSCKLEEMSLKTQSGYTDAELKTKLDVIHRFIRLQRKLGWSMQDLDRAFTALKPKVRFGTSAPPSSFLVQLSHIERLCKLLKLPIVNLLSFWSDIDTTNYEGKDRQLLPSLYDKLFQNKILLGGNLVGSNNKLLEAFSLNSITATISEHGSVLLAVLGVGEADLELLVNELVNELDPPDKDKDKLNLTGLSILYRHVLLAKALKLKISELLALKTLINIDPFDPKNTVDPKHTENALLFVETLQRIREAGFSVQELNYLYWHQDDPVKPLAPSPQDLIKLSQTLLNELGRINEATRVDVASEDQFRTHLATMLDETQLNAAFKFLTESSLLNNTEKRDAIDQYFGFFLPENFDYSELLALLGSDEAGQKEKTIAYLSELLMPFLRNQQCRAMIRQTLSEMLKLDKLVAASLLDKQLLSQSNPNDPDYSAINDFLDLQNTGLIASYTGEDAQGSSVTVTQTDHCLDFDWGSTAPAEGIEPGTLQEVTWNGKLLAPSSESYTFHLDATGDAELVIEVEDNNQITVTKSSGAPPQSSQPISFTSGEVYTISLTYTPSVNETPRIRLSWSSPSTTEAVITQNCLYPDDSYGNFTNSYTLLWKAALLISRFRLTVKEIEYLSEHSVEFDGFNLNDLPIEPLPSGEPDPPGPKLFTQWERLYAFTNLRDSLPVNEAGLTDVFALASTPEKAQEKLAEATGWDMDELLGLTGENLKNEIRLLNLRDQLAFSYRLGVTTEDLKNWREFPSEAVAAQKQAQAIKNALKSRYEDEQWLEVAKPLKNKLREQQRSALVTYLLANPQVLHLTSLKDSNDLYDQLLIDVEMSACQMTSRIKQANSSVQLFVQRCLMGLEPQVSLDKSAANQWKWMKNYRVWEANRKVFLYPENWIEPELRDDKSPFFKEMENDLLQGEIHMENVETAYRNYLEKLDDVALLDVRGMYWQFEEGVNILHVFARTRGGAPFRYYYRRWLNGTYWTPWEKVNVDIQGDHLVPVVYNRRLRLYWPKFEEKPQENVDTASDNPPKLHWEIKLAWSEYKNGKWSAKKISDGFIKTIDRKESVHRSEYTEDQYFFLPVHRPEVHRPEFAALIILCFEKPQKIIASYDITQNPSPTGEYKDGKWNWHFNDTETALGSFDIIGCHDTIIYCWPCKYFNGQTFNFCYSTIILGNDVPKEAFYEPDRFDEWNALQQAKWWYDYALPDLAWNSDYNNEMVIEGDDPYSDSLMPTFALLTGATPGTFRLQFLNQYGPGAKAIDQMLELYHRSGNYLIPSRHAILPFHYIDDTKAFFVLPAGITTHELRPSYYVNSLSYKFQSFYHPYSCRFISELNRHGIDGLLDPPDQDSDLKRQFSHNIFFNDQYQPSDKIEKPYPIEWIDFTYSGSYSLYNWELFFHAPLMIADRLMKDQRFEDAQKWFHYIFDPTLGDDPDFLNFQSFMEDILGLTGINYNTVSTARRYWKIQPFFLNFLDHISIQQLMGLMAYAIELDEDNPVRKSLKNMVDQWRKDPFKPHLIARLRISAYQKTVVMKYLDNLIAWADNLFRRDTMESINEATQLYILAAKILGPRPAEVQSRNSVPVKTYNDLEPNLDAFSNTIVEIENHLFSSMIVKNNNLPNSYKKKILLPELQDSGWSSVSATLSSPSLYFCIPHNEEMLEYWDTISDRLFKVRHCMNIEGVVRQLPLFEPPINPALLVKAAAAGLDIGSVLQDLYAPMPKYRFQVMLQKALELCGEVKSLGAALLSALEKKDAEALSMLRTDNEIELLKVATRIKEKQVEEAEESIAVLNESKSIATIRKTHYENISTRLPEESHYLDKQAESVAWQILSQEAAFIGTSAATPVPEVTVAGRTPTAAGVDTKVVSGEKIAQIANLVSMYLGWLGQIANVEGTEASYKAGLTRSQQDRDLQIKLATQEIQQIEKQIEAAKIRKEIVEKELDHHNKQIERAEAVQTVMQEKFTNQELYSWMTSQISGIYFQCYKLAYDLAKQAERAFRFELGLDDSDYIQFGYWDSLNKGLLAGEKLFHDLKCLEIAFLDKNKREFEITKHISLRQLDPVALLSLKAIGSCEVSLPEWLFDLDTPGHYMRRLKNVSLSIPAVTGPYTSINCTLSLLKSSLRRSPLLPNDEYARATKEEGEEEDTRFVDCYGTIQSIVTSNAQNDSGMFETNLRDERFLPFEGTGAVSTWRIELPQDFRQFDYNTISDVILHIRYTARQGGSQLKDKAVAYLKQFVATISEPGLTLLLSLNHDFPSEWHKFVTGANFVATIKKEYFPYFVQGEDINISNVELYAVEDKELLSGVANGVIVGDLTTALQVNNEFEISLAVDGVLQRTEDAQVFLVIKYTLSSEVDGG